MGHDSSSQLSFVSGSDGLSSLLEGSLELSCSFLVLDSESVGGCLEVGVDCSQVADPLSSDGDSGGLGVSASEFLQPLGVLFLVGSSEPLSELLDLSLVHDSGSSLSESQSSQSLGVSSSEGSDDSSLVVDVSGSGNVDVSCSDSLVNPS